MSSKNQCSLCDDELSAGNPIKKCIQCGIQVHVCCYGIISETSRWKCSPCQLKVTNHAKCQLCSQKKGPMKRTKCGKWVHVICALFTEGTTFCDENKMEPVDISKVSGSKRNKLCVFCGGKQGFGSICSMKGCKHHFHITCAQKKGSLKEESNSEDDKLKFQAYCNEHIQPSDSMRRLSAEWMKNFAESKREITEIKRKSAKSNATWIMNRIEGSEPKSNDKTSGIIDNEKTKQIPIASTSNWVQSVTGKDREESPANEYDFTNQISTDSECNGVQSEEDKENVHKCYKDRIIHQLKEENERISNDLKMVQDLNYQLQKKVLVAPIPEDGPVAQVDLQQLSASLEKLNVVLATKESDDGLDLIFPNKVKIAKNKARYLRKISSEPSHDREYVNKFFVVLYSDKYLNKLIAKGWTREKILDELRKTKRHQILKAMYEHRILMDRRGSLEMRLKLFKLAFRTKFNNWWLSHAPKLTFETERTEKDGATN